MPKLSLSRRLHFYAEAVQQPLAEIRFVERAHAWHRRRAKLAARQAFFLREDFAGTCDIAAAWVRSDEDREAIGVERHGPTLAWAARRHADLDRFHPVEADVCAFHGPRVDATLATNFSVLGWHTRPALLAYFRHARRCLRPGGVFVMDLFGGPGAERPGVQERDAGGFGYRWEQRSHDPRTARIDCRIRFELDGAVVDGFSYDWRLWRPADLLEALAEAGFDRPTLWASDGRGTHRPGGRLEAGEDFVCYLSGARV